MEKKDKIASRLHCPAPQHQLTSQSTSESEQPNTVQQTQAQQPLPPPSIGETLSSATSVTSPHPRDSQDSLSFSEPSLRFPRPKVDKRLANWITSSDPDIMRMTTVPGEDSNSLAGSTYELITGADDDTWSQDGRDQDHDLISESVSSLDAQRTDDVHSLADTEQMSDDEFAHIEETDNTPRNSRYRAIPGVGADPPVFSSQHSRHHCDEQDETDSEDDAGSRSSLEYAQESLRTPSIPTPEASNIIEKHADEEIKVPLANNGGVPTMFEAARKYVTVLLDTLHVPHPAFRDVRQVSRVALPWFVFFIGACLIPQFIIRPPSQDAVPPTTTVYVTTTSTHTVPPLISPTTSPDQPVGYASKLAEAGLIPAQNSRSTEWIFGSKKPEVTFSTPSSTKLVAHIPKNIKQIWLSEDCVEVVSTREGRNIAMTIIPVNEGLVVRFPRSEAYGVVDVTFRASCKPTLHRVLKVHFGKGILEEVYEMTRHIAQDLTEFVPVAAQQAERQIGNAKRSWGYVADSVGTTALSVRGTMSKSLSTWKDNSRQYLKKAETNMAKATTSLSTFVTTIRDEATEYCDELSEVRLRAQHTLKLELLSTQIAAKIWWFKVTGRDEQAADYRRKAKDFLFAKELAAQKAMVREMQEHGGDNFFQHLGGLLRGQGSRHDLDPSGHQEVKCTRQCKAKSCTKRVS